MYNTAISALGKATQWELAEKLFGEIPEPDKISFETMIAAYGLAGQTSRAEMFFNAMLDAGFVPRDYAFCGLIAAYRYAFHNKFARADSLPDIADFCSLSNHHEIYCAS